MSEKISLLVADTQSAVWPDIAALRRTVFIDEQHVPEHEEWDAADSSAIHIAALHGTSRGQTNDGQIIGCARLLYDGQIGRMVVLKNWRHRGVGNALLQFTLGVARRQAMSHVFLNAQTHAIGFYQQAGFIVIGDEFMDAGIAHKRMTRVLL